MTPSVVDVLASAVALHRSGRLREAEEGYREVLSVAADNVDATHLLGLLLAGTARRDDGLALLDRAIALDPDNAIIYNNRGVANKDAGRLDRALESYRKAIAIDPRFAVAHFNAANILGQLGRNEEALGHYAEAIRIDHEYSDAYNNRGILLSKLGRFEQAVAGFDAAIALRPKLADAHLNRGAALAKLRRNEEALASYEQVLALNPEHAPALKNRGNLLRQAGQTDDALASYCREVKVLQSNPHSRIEDEEAWRDLLEANTIPLAYKSQADLDSIRERVEAIIQRLHHRVVDGGERSAVSAGDQELAFHLDGFAFAYHQRNDRHLMRSFSSVLSRLLGADAFSGPSRKRRSGPIRIGVAGQRLRDHNGANWAHAWLSQLPRTDYDLCTYAFEAASDEVARGFQRLGTHRLLGFAAESYQSTMRTILDDELDILMLPEVGMAPASRILSLHRLAPVQFTAWGHPVTSGSPNMDYYLSSDLMEPVDADEHYTETLVRLPNLGLYLVPQAERPALRRTDLPEGRVLYGCLQSLFKYVPRYDYLLAEIALALPAALFVFLEGKPAYLTDITRTRLERAFAEIGLDASRHLLFLPRTDRAGYLNLQSQMDILVDSVGWSGGNTSISAIEAGVPIVTLPGEFMRGRHTSAMLRLIGVHDLIAASHEDFVAKLVELGRDAEMRLHTAKRIGAGSPLLYRDRAVIDKLDSFFKSRVQ